MEENIAKIWDKTVTGVTSIDRWEKKLRMLRKHSKGWNKKCKGIYRRKKEKILSQIDKLDQYCETHGMDTSVREEWRRLEPSLFYVVREERVKWLQRSNEKDLIEGDNYTRYYHAKANGRKRKGQIHCLLQEEGQITEQNNLMQ